MADALVFASEASQASLRAAFPESQLQLQKVVLNPAPALSEPPTEAPLADDSPVNLGFVGRLSAEKQPELLLQMLTLLPPNHRLTLVGDGPLGPSLQAQARQLGLTDRVHFAGAGAVTAATYQGWQATLLCSAYEGYPMAALESLAAGIPCISTPLPAMRQMLAPLAPDWLARGNTPQDLADAVGRLRQTPPRTHRQLAHSIARLHPRGHFEQQWHRVLQRCSHQQRSGPQCVHFIHGGPAYLPELQAYAAHLQALGHRSQQHSSPATVPADADIVWWMCGTVSSAHMHRLRHSVHVHEYASASVGRWPAFKDRYKRWQSPAPAMRVFLNDWVRERMGFDDGVPHCLRDMGVPPAFLQARPPAAVDHDLVYLGEMSRLLECLPALQAIGQAGLRLLLVGEVPQTLQNRLQAMPGLTLTGRVPQQAVPDQLLRARAGLNLMPVRMPLIMQTSTKVLEYLAVGLPVLSNDYPWVRSTAAAHPDRIVLVQHTERAEAWSAAMRSLPPALSNRQGLQALTWPAVLSSMPLWEQLGLTGTRP